MPKVFNENDRKIIKENLMKYGLEALENGGYKSASIELIAKQAGIAKGTFYNFFRSKEHFFLEIMLSIRDKNRNDLLCCFSSKKCFNREDVANFLYERYTASKTIYHYFNTDEVKIIFRRIPEQISICNIDSTAFAAELFAGIPDVNPKLNNEVVINVMNIMGNLTANDELISVGSKDETIRFLADSLASYIFEEVV